MPKDRTALTLAALVGLAGTPHAAFAQHTQIICEASGDYGVTWHNNLTVWPGQRVDVRVRFSIEEIPPGQVVLLLSGATYQPCLFRWRPDAGDRHIPFTFPGVDGVGSPTTETAYSGRHIIDGVGTTGRLNPFGAGSQSVTSSSGLLSAFHDPGGVLRFSGSKNTTPTLNVAWGVATAQHPCALAHINYNFSRTPVVFRYALKVNRHSTSERELIAIVPREYVSGGVVRWYTNCTGTNPLHTPVLPEGIIPATIVVRARCQADLAGTNVPDPTNASLEPDIVADGAVNAEDLLYFLGQFERGEKAADLDDGSGEGVQDQAVTIDDLLFFLVHFEQGC